ncbi:MAG: TRAP transporter small permease [Alphaproteobacteria bacterium]
MAAKSRSTLSRVIDEIEETLIAIILGLMTLITFANVVVRYVFNGNILWGLEVTVFLFAWMVLLGASYGVKHSVHLGVDILINALPPVARKVLALIAVTICLAFSFLILKGSWDYWYPFVTDRAFLETEDVPMPEFMQFLSTWLNDGERYEKIPRFIPYAALPLGMGLLTFRYLQAVYRILTGQIDRLIASHEAEDAVESLQSNKK